jgi:hypothetical protein
VVTPGTVHRMVQGGPLRVMVLTIVLMRHAGLPAAGDAGFTSPEAAEGYLHPRALVVEGCLRLRTAMETGDGGQRCACRRAGGPAAAVGDARAP